MPVAARNNLPGSFTFNESLPITTVTTNKSTGAVSTSTGYTFRVTHYCKKSPLVKVRVTKIGNTTIRRSSSYERFVMDSPKTYFTQVRETSTSKRIRNSPCDLSYSALHLQGRGSLSGPYTASEPSDAVNQAIIGALSKLGDTKASIGVALGEAKESYTLLADTSIKLWKLYIAVRRRQLSELKSILGDPKALLPKDGFDAWLKYQYAWKPLVMDLYRTYNYMRSISDKEMLVYGKGYAKRQNKFSGSDTRYAWDYDVSQKGYCGITAAVKFDQLRAFNRAGMLNPFEVAWELVPLSFVVDWWLPIGNVLSVYSARSGLSFVDGYSGSVSEVTVSARNTRTYADASVTEVERGEHSVRYFAHRRQAMTSWPLPGLYVKESPMNLEKGWSALALYYQATGLK